ncbi:serum paraoxonase/arylesterase [Biscogniauxia mediterranea]|nr:serum paraoxonase/arylesterase [Biscogniauxia mediterranea]
MALFLYLTVTVLGALAAFLYAPLKQGAIVMGLTRPLASWVNVHGLENRVIEDTVACEDVHYHAPTGMLYLGCIGDLVKASGWFPGADALEHPEDPARGTFVVVDTKTLKSQKLELVGFPGPFVPHGISIYSAPSDPATVYIFAVNHVPNAAAWTPQQQQQQQLKTASRIEVFAHDAARAPAQARHLRTVAHPLIRTPNDLLALSERELLVTNDHRYLEGPLRVAEELARVVPRVGAWCNTVHVLLPEDGSPPNATVALDSIPTNNGLGWGSHARQILLSDATGGGLYFASPPDPRTRRVAVSHRVQTDGVVDNPSFYADAYAGDSGGTDYSGYVLAGAGRAVDFVKNFKDPAARAPLPSLVWYVPASAGEEQKKKGGKEEVRLLFSDDGSSARGATTAVMVPIDPQENAGKREAWLFVTGAVAPHMLATRIDLEKALG